MKLDHEKYENKVRL